MTSPIRSGRWTRRGTPENPILGAFGWTRDSGRREHRGFDFAAELGEPVFASHAGLVARCGWEHTRHGRPHNGGYGLRLILDGADGVQTRYGHLSYIVPYEPGMHVQRGDLIGRVGCSGNCEPNDPHLHFEVRIDGTPVNPLWWLQIPGESRDGFPNPVIEA